MSVFLCFVGHGAFGLRQKAEWLAFLRPFGFSDEAAFLVMPAIGVVDIASGCLALVRPTRVVLVFNVAWALFTAALRPVIGMSFFEFLERAGNYGPAAALLLGTAGLPWLARVMPAAAEAGAFGRLKGLLALTTALLLIGHGGLALLAKPMLVEHWSFAGAISPSFVQLLGAGEILTAIALLLRPSAVLCLGVAAWKIYSESLFIVAGAPLWEFVERGGSYGAPLALAVLLVRQRAIPHSRTPAPDVALS